MISIVKYLYEGIAANVTNKLMQLKRDEDDNLEGLVKEISPKSANVLNKGRQIGYRLNQMTGGNWVARVTGAPQLPPPEKSS